MSARAVQWRLFLTCWVVFSLHFATDFVREHFLVVSMVEDHTFRLDRYKGMHADIFETPDGHSHHGANPGISMIGAIPYFVLRPAVAWVVQRELAAREARGDTLALYNDSRPARVEFFRAVRRQGWDIKFGLVCLITLVFCMAPLSALGAVVMFRTLNRAGLSQRLALGGAFLYALGTPIFFRTGYLNQNLAVAIFGFMAFALLWDPGDRSPMTMSRRYLLAGFLGGLALLCDYSGGLVLGVVGVYGLLRRLDFGALSQALRDSLWYAAGALGPILVLWWYQWASFGHLLYPPQHYMPPDVYLSDAGYKGVVGPQADLLAALLFDPRFGLFVTGPVLALALAAPFLNWRKKSFVPWRETLTALAVSLAYLLFFSMVRYTKLQYISGIRYLVPAIPFLLVLTVAVLIRLPRWIAYGLAILSFALSWGLAMYRFQEQESSILVGLRHVFLEGFQLPAVTTLSRMAAQYAPELAHGVSPLPVFVLAGVVIWAIWRIELPALPLSEDP